MLIYYVRSSKPRMTKLGHNTLGFWCIQYPLSSLSSVLTDPLNFYDSQLAWSRRKLLFTFQTQRTLNDIVIASRPILTELIVDLG